MSSLRFDWDVRKAAANQRKHGVTFEEARSVFEDDFAQIIGDPDHSTDEQRFVILGMSLASKILVVCHCYREEDVIRIISARPATRRERAFYER